MKLMTAILFSLISLNVAAKTSTCPVAVGGIASLAKRHSGAFVFLNKKKYKFNQSMTIDAGVVNNGDDRLYVYGNIAWGYGGGLILHVNNGERKEIVTDVMDDAMLPPPRTDDDLGVFVELDAGNFFGTRRSFPLDKVVTRPGKYVLTVEYNSPLPCSVMSRRLQSLPILWHEDESLISNQIEFEVVP